jgi:hypothetical protein
MPTLISATRSVQAADMAEKSIKHSADEKRMVHSMLD